MTEDSEATTESWLLSGSSVPGKGEYKAKGASVVDCTFGGSWMSDGGKGVTGSMRKRWCNRKACFLSVLPMTRVRGVTR